MKIDAGFLMTPAGQAVVLAALVGGAMYVGAKKAKEAASAVGGAVNPNSQDNIIYQGVKGVGATLTDNENFDLGAWIYDKIHGETMS